ncbi:MAG: hypothetical protein ACRDLS_09960 [Solirubrobacteraceae bacterium]
MERDPEAPLADDEDIDLFGDPDEIDASIEEELDERLQDEREGES